MVAKRRIILLVEPLPVLLAAYHPELDTPALQTIASRGDALRGLPTIGAADDLDGRDADGLRCALFGHEAKGSFHPPSAALHLMATEGRVAAAETFYLRLDPVTLSVDRVSVVMSGYGFADLDSSEREIIATLITEALAAEELQVLLRNEDGWILALPRALPFEFSPLSAALGADCAELLPNHPETLPWKRIINEVQMALHASVVNQQRRQSGRREINSVWFWGGGQAPGPSKTCRIHSVYSDHPVSRGLAVLQGCALAGLAGMNTTESVNLPPDAFDILVDWEGSRISAEQDLLELEKFAEGLLAVVRSADLELQLVDGSGAGWSFDRRCARRFWRKRLALGPDFQRGATR